MEPRSTPPRRPRRNDAPRDYRTLTLPAISRPPRVPYSADDQMAADGWPDEIDERVGAPPWRGAEDVSQPTRAVGQVTARSPRTRHDDAESDRRETRALAAVAPSRRRPTSVALPATGGLLVLGNRAKRGGALDRPLRATTRRPPIHLAGILAFALAIGLAVAAPRVSAIAADSTCAWYTVKAGDTLNDIGMAHHSTAAAVAQANHISTSTPLYVGERLCIPTTWWSASRLAPAVPGDGELALPPGVMAGEPCTQDRAIVWTVPVSQWAIPPGCFGKIYYPNPRDYMVNGRVIGGFGWCNWWPEALLRDPNALSLPEHSQVRVGWPVFYKPQPGEHIGHYAFVESIGPGGWILISEMNMSWRGAGWARVDYRYIAVNYPGATYLYPNS
jgi:LysM repeat protein